MGLTLTRLEGWEGRLNAAIDAARSTPYKLGERDCCWLACCAILALTGKDLWPEWAGRYATRREAARLIREYSRKGFAPAVSRRLGVDPVGVLLARRGDLLEYRDRESHIGVCIGAVVAVFGETGLVFVSLSDCVQAWRIG